mmetsp:Transcript_18465/g.36964  ORF Transcript_18465/g.36964 Transcript_18465/m.36964 type:complete len:504 (+) Transcript_18465:28-1539(+)
MGTKFTKQIQKKSKKEKKPPKNRPAANRNMAGKQESVALITDHLSDVREKYHIQPKELGHGHYGVVRKCQERATGEWFAIKSIRKKKVGKLDVLRREIDILKEVDHPNIIKLHEVYEDEKYLHLVTELCTGGELFDRIIAKTQSAEGHFSEHDAAEIVRDIIAAIRYCHDEKHICHRDLKPENFLFESAEEHAVIKIIDFGLSRHEDTSPSHMMKTKVGTPYYVAPEVLNKEYDKSCDMWSIGVISYILLCGYPPFYGDNDHEIFVSVKAAKFDFPSPEWDTISEKAKDFIMCLLKKDPSKRLTANNALDHPWFADLGVVDKKTLPKILHGNTTVGTKFQHFMGMNKLKKAAYAHIATHLTHNEAASLEDLFRSIDKDGDGTLTVDELREALASGGFSKDINDEIESMIQDLAVEGHHALDWKEFVSATVDKSVIFKEDKIKMAFDYFDRSHRGSLTVADLKSVLGSEEQAMEIMGQIDVKKDGVISYEEFHNMMEEEGHITK